MAHFQRGARRSARSRHRYKMRARCARKCEKFSLRGAREADSSLIFRIPVESPPLAGLGVENSTYIQRTDLRARFTCSATLRDAIRRRRGGCEICARARTPVSFAYEEFPRGGALENSSPASFANGRTTMYRAASGSCTCSHRAAGAITFADSPFFFM